MIMQKLIDEYLDFTKKRSHSSKTHITYKDALRVFVDNVGDDAELTEETYRTFLKATSTMNPASQALCRSVVKSLYSYARVPTSFFQQVNKELAVKNPDGELTFNKAGIDKIIQHVDTMRNDLTDLRDRAFVLFLVDTGLRNGEACSLRIGNIDWNEGKVSFTGKGNRKATAHISNRAMDALRDYLRERGNSSKALPLFLQHSRKDDEIRQVTPGVMWYAIKQRAKEAGVDADSIRVHDFRHYFVTVAYAASKDIRLVQQWARHKKIETTTRYTHLVDDSGEEYDKIFNKE
jgi:site-specific recombinase XerD